MSWNENLRELFTDNLRNNEFWKSLWSSSLFKALTTLICNEKRIIVSFIQSSIFWDILPVNNDSVFFYADIEKQLHHVALNIFNRKSFPMPICLFFILSYLSLIHETLISSVNGLSLLSLYERNFFNLVNVGSGRLS